MKPGIKKYIAISIAVCIGCAASILSSCNNLNAKPATNDLISFGFKKADNPWLDDDINGIIDQTSRIVRITVPESAYKQTDPSNKENRKFKASFTVSPKAKLYKGTAEQKSGVLEELFIINKEYRVIDEDGASKTYTVDIKIKYTKPTIAPADAETVKQFYGSYHGKLSFDNNSYDICFVCNEEKVSSYSQAMSAVYTNMQWTKVSPTEWICKTYFKTDFGRKKKERNTVTFKIDADGKITCKLVVNAMGNAPSNDMEKGADYIWASDDGKAFKDPSEP